MMYKTIGQNIRERRIQLHITQHQLAESADISLSFLGHIERGTRKLSVDTLYKIALALNCSADELMGNSSWEVRKNTAAREILRRVMQMVEEQP